MFKYLLLVAAGLGAGLLTYLLWRWLGRGPRRRRAHLRARRLLQEGDWQAALEIADTWRSRRNPPHWDGQFRQLAAECHRLAEDAAFAEGRLDDVVRHAETAASLRALEDPTAERTRAVERLLGELRRKFAAEESPEAISAYAGRLFALDPSCAEARFWQALAGLRAGQPGEQVAAALLAVHELAGKRFLDPPLYLGTLLLRDGRTAEAVRLLSEANRLDPGCPLLTWQLGLGLMASGGDANFAARALQRAARGLAQLKAHPGGRQHAWADAFPEGKSFVRRLAAGHPFPCPVFGADFGGMTRQVLHALAQAQCMLGNFQSAAETYGTLLQETAPTVPLLRGLGLALARLERYDQAYKHLRTAWDQEEPKTHLTSGYLALCGALGKPSQADDRPKNVAWAIRLLARFPVTGDAEWARIYRAVFAEARTLGMAVDADDLARLCDVLASADGAGPDDAASYDQLAAAAPDRLRPEHALLYARAAAVHGYQGVCDRALFALAFRDLYAAEAFFTRRSWDAEEVEFTNLQRAARRASGGFPPELGPTYPVRGERILRERLRRLEALSEADAARTTAEVWLALVPASCEVHDQLARLHYRNGDGARAIELLQAWARLSPTDPVPLLRHAVIEMEYGNAASSLGLVDRALGRASGRRRGAAAFLGARLALSRGITTSARALAERYLAVCLREDPGHVEALCLRATLPALVGDNAVLATLAPVLTRPEATEPCLHYLAALAHLAAGAAVAAQEAVGRALATARETTAPFAHFAEECSTLSAWAHLLRGDSMAATMSLLRVVEVADCPSVDHARALLGRLAFDQGHGEEALRWWQAVTPERRQAWGMDRTLPATAFLNGLVALDEGPNEAAVERFRTAAELGWQDARLGPLLTLALVRAGQRLLYADPARPSSRGTLRTATAPAYEMKAG